jgi:hypothetical protein
MTPQVPTNPDITAFWDLIEAARALAGRVSGSTRPYAMPYEHQKSLQSHRSLFR